MNFKKTARHSGIGQLAQHLGDQGRKTPPSVTPAWAPLWLHGQPELHNETVSKNEKEKPVRAVFI